MPAKKKGKKGEAKEQKLLLGRPKNTVEIGIVGYPNVGKSTFFNTLTELQVPAENYSFCTMDPHECMVPVPDERFDFLVEKFQPNKVTPAVLRVVDIAGLVKGASEGKGVGNAFLSNVSATDAIFHVCRGFKGRRIEHFEGSVDPVRDLETIAQELRLKDLQRVTPKVQQLTTQASRGNALAQADTKKELATMVKVKEMLEAGQDVRFGDWTPEDVVFLNQMLFLSAKPVVCLLNISEKDFIAGKSKWMGPVKEWINAKCPGTPLIPFSAKLESKLHDMTEDEKKAYLTEHKTFSMLPRIIKAGYHALSLCHFFTIGQPEVRAWTIREGTKAPQAGKVIHNDFETGFVKLEQMTFDHFKEHGGEAGVRAAGQLKQQGKNYVVQDGDICNFIVSN